MGPMILRPGQRLIVPGLRVFQPSMATLTQWWLSGGISAANCIAAYQPKGAADLASSYINLANPGTNNAAPGTAPTFATGTGWTFNGSAQYLTTDVIPAVNQTWTFIVRYSNYPLAVAGYVLGNRGGGSTGFNIGPSSISYFYSSSGTAVSPGAAAATVALAGQQGYRNGASDGAALATASVTNVAFFVGARNNNGSADTYFNGNVLALAIYNITLNSTQVAALTTAMANL